MDFVAVLKQKADLCDFGDMKNSFICDKIIHGVRDVKCSERLLDLRDDELSLEKVIAICRQTEMTKASSSRSVRQFQRRGRSRGRFQRRGRSRDIFRNRRSVASLVNLALQVEVAADTPTMETKVVSKDNLPVETKVVTQDNRTKDK
eukprot:GHVU01200501.1.p1 GENE.GHVU01200501.1~~GHVU01200501.1.p1  ORF type:complete len:147 (+),score=11.25 GHVU01200501.1:591-1031(+)